MYSLAATVLAAREACEDRRCRGEHPRDWRREVPESVCRSRNAPSAVRPQDDRQSALATGSSLPLSSGPGESGSEARPPVTLGNVADVQRLAERGLRR